MKKVALIFGFSYENGEEAFLRSSYVDLFITYDYLSKRGFTCYIYNDFSSFDIAESLYKEKQLGAKFLAFHSLNKKDEFTLDYNNIFNNVDLKDELLKTECLFLYYTGHMTENGEFCFPGRMIKIREFFSCIGALTKAECQIFCIVDSCYSGTEIFPYKFDGNNVILQKNISSDLFLLRQECVYLYSANGNQKAASSDYRSHFTKYIFRQLDQGVAAFSLVLTETQRHLTNRKKTGSQTAGIFTSCKMPARIWPWMFGYIFSIHDDILLIRR